MVEIKLILKELSGRHRCRLTHINLCRGNLIICFSGIPGSGKSYIAKRIADRYKGVIISTDGLRNLIKDMAGRYPELLQENRKEDILHKYLYNLIEERPFSNGLIILDKGIDRDYKKIFSIIKKKKFKVFIIRVCAPKDVLIERVRTKLGGELDTNFINNLDRWTREFKDFGKKVKSDVVINNQVNGTLDLDMLFEMLDERVLKR